MMRPRISGSERRWLMAWARRSSLGAARQLRPVNDRPTPRKEALAAGLVAEGSIAAMLARRRVRLENLLHRISGHPKMHDWRATIDVAARKVERVRGHGADQSQSLAPLFSRQLFDPRDQGLADAPESGVRQNIVEQNFTSTDG